MQGVNYAFQKKKLHGIYQKIPMLIVAYISAGNAVPGVFKNFFVIWRKLSAGK